MQSDACRIFRNEWMWYVAGLCVLEAVVVVLQVFFRAGNTSVESSLTVG